VRVLHLTSHLNVGGITLYILSLSHQLKAMGHEVVVASAGGRLETQARSLGLTHWQVPLNTSQEFSPKILRSIRQIRDQLREQPVDILHAHTRVGQVVADQLSRQLRIPYVTTWHGLYRTRLGRRLYPCTGQTCMAISEVVREHLRKDFRVPDRRIQLIYNGVNVEHYGTAPAVGDVEAYRKRWGIPARKPLIGGIGRMAAGKVKGFDLLLAAACLLKDSKPDLQILLVGDGPRRPFLEDVAERLGIRDRVHFAGAAEDIRIPLALMDVFVFPSRWPEAFGLTLVEAMAAGKPVVATRIGAVPEIVRDGVDGLLFDPEDAQALTGALSRLIDDRSLAQGLARSAARRAREQFSAQQMAARVDQVYRETLGRG